jgi:hypothetical protein
MKTFAYISILSDFAPVVFGLLHYRSLKSDTRIAFLFLVIAALVDVTLSILSYENTNNEWLCNAFSLFEGIVFFYLILYWSEHKNFKRIWLPLSLVYAAYWFTTTVLLHSIMVFNTDEKSIKGILLIILSGTMIVRLSLKDNQSLLQDYRFWFLSGIFVFYAITLATYLTATAIISKTEVGMMYSWYLNWFMAIITNLIFSYSFICFNQKKTMYTS